MNAILALVLGVLLRLVLPLVLTALVVIWLRKLDARWQAEAELERKSLVAVEKPCWKEQGLSMEEQKTLLSGQPCWQTRRLPNGYLREECLDCEVFLSAPAPAPRPKHKMAHA